MPNVTRDFTPSLLRRSRRCLNSTPGHHGGSGPLASRLPKYCRMAAWLVPALVALTMVAEALAQAPGTPWPPPPVTVPSLGSPGAPRQPATVPSLGIRDTPYQPRSVPSAGSRTAPLQPATTPSLGLGTERYQPYPAPSVRHQHRARAAAERSIAVIRFLTMDVRRPRPDYQGERRPGPARIRRPLRLRDRAEALTRATMTNASGVFLLSLLAWWLFAKTFSIWPPTIAHPVNNAVSALLLSSHG